MLLFEFFVQGPPVSLQAHRAARKEAYKRRVSASASAGWTAGTPLIASDVAVIITHFYEGAPADVDNISKLILDGLKGTVLVDDKQITDLVLQHRPLLGPYAIPAPTPEMSRGLGLGKEFVHIAVGSPPLDGELRTHDNA